MPSLHLWNYNWSYVSKLDETEYERVQKSMFIFFLDKGTSHWNKPDAAEINFLSDLPRLRSFSCSRICLLNYVKLSF